MITSVGIGYTGFNRWLLGADFRYVDFANADGFRQSGYDPNGAVQGLGFRGIFAMSLGAQYDMTDWNSPEKVDTGLRVMRVAHRSSGTRIPGTSVTAGCCRRPR